MPRNGGFSLRRRSRPGRTVMVGAITGLVLALSIMQVLRSWQEMSGARPLHPTAGTLAQWGSQRQIPPRLVAAPGAAARFVQNELKPRVVRAQEVAAPVLRRAGDLMGRAWIWTKDDGAPRAWHWTLTVAAQVWHWTAEIAAPGAWTWLRLELPLVTRQAGNQLTNWTQRWRSGFGPSPCGPRGCLGEISLSTHPPV